MADDLSQTPTWNLLYRIRENFSVPLSITQELERRISAAKETAARLEWAQRRIAFLEHHVPPEILNPPEPVRYAPRFTGD